MHRLLTITLLFIHCACQSQSELGKSDVDTTVKEISQLYADNYTFPDRGKQVADALINNLNDGVYYGLSGDSLAARIRRHIYKLTNDRHVAVFYRGKANGKTRPGPGEFLNQVDNFGFTEVQIKEGNVGYVKMPVFFPIQMNAKAMEAADAMMKEFRKCRAIVFDLRDCKGGDPNMISYLISYLYPRGSRIHLNDFYYRPNNSTMSTYTREVPGEPLPDVNVFVLTSGKTFSAGEEFSYDLKNLKRSRIVGEVTGGGAHAVEPRTVGSFELMLPTGRAINPITKTNWEGRGVEPTVRVEAEHALEKALEIIRQES